LEIKLGRQFLPIFSVHFSPCTFLERLSLPAKEEIGMAAIADKAPSEEAKPIKFVVNLFPSEVS
jgi:hypothetical protein